MTDKQTPITAQAADIRRTLRAAAVAADREWHPGLMGVLLHTETVDDRNVLVATATDRFILAQVNLTVEGTLPEPAFIATDDVHLLTDFLRLGVAEVQVSYEARALTVAGARFGGQWASITVPAGETVIPTNVAEKFGPWVPSHESTPFAPHLLKRLAKIAKRLHAEVGTVHIGLSELNKPLIAHIGDLARVVLMPHRQNERPIDAPPVFNPYPNGARA